MILEIGRSGPFTEKRVQPIHPLPTEAIWRENLVRRAITVWDDCDKPDQRKSIPSKRAVSHSAMSLHDLGVPPVFGERITAPLGTKANDNATVHDLTLHTPLYDLAFKSDHLGIK